VPRDPVANQRIKDERRESILRAARDVFARKGLAATRMSDIASEAGQSHGLVYHYFPSKELVYTEVVEQAMNERMAIIESTLGSEDAPLERLKAFCAALRENACSTPQAMLLNFQALAASIVPAEARSAIDRMREHGFQRLVRTIVEGQRDGSVVEGDPAELAVALLASIHGLGLVAMLDTEGKRPIPRVETLIRLLSVR